MGVAQSSNVSEAVTDIANYVSNSTQVNTNQVNQLSNQVILENCDIELSGDFTVNESSQINIQNNQIASAKQDASLENNIQQQMLQEATSKVGALGVGYANASNSASELVNDSSTILNTLYTEANQFSNTVNTFECENSKIVAKNLNIGMSTTNDFLAQQTINNSQTASIINDVSQSITQKASATVEGIGGLIIAILLIIAVLIYAISKPLNSGGVKIAIGVVLCFCLVGILIFMYLRKTPPFFAEPNQCINGSSIGCSSGCVSQKDSQISLDNPPLRYIYGLIDGDQSKAGTNLLRMAVASTSYVQPTNGDNGGYRMDTAISLNNATFPFESIAQQIGITNIPSILINYNSTSNVYYKIPSEFSISQGGGTCPSCTPKKGSKCPSCPDNTTATCTPKILQLATGSSGSLNLCDNVIDPIINQLQTTQDPTQGIANLNLSEWETYLSTNGSGNDTVVNRALFARFVLCYIIGNIDLHLYMYDEELVFPPGADQPVLAKNAVDCYMYIPNDQGTGEYKGRNGLTDGGMLSGKVGYCNDRQYKVNKFMTNIGGWILLALIVLIFVYMGYTSYKNKKSNEKVPEK